MRKINKSEKKTSYISSKSKYYNDTIEAKPKKKNKGFFSKRNLILIVIFSIISILILFLTVRFIININWKLLTNSIKTGLGRKIGVLWLSLLLVYFVWCVFGSFAPMLIRYRQYGIHVPFGEYMLFAFTSSFLKVVTPWMVADSYSIFWMKRQNIPTHLATSVAFSNSLLWSAVQIIVTLPSFIIIMANYRALIYVNGISGAFDNQGLSIMILSCVGMFIDLVSIFLMLLLNTSKKIHYVLSTMFNKIKKVFHMKYHTKAEIEEKYKNKAVLKQDFIDFCKNWKYFLATVAFLIVGEIFTYVSLTWALYFVQMFTYDGQQYIVKFEFWWAFHCTNVAFTANRINFLPNGMGGLEWIISVLLTKMGGWVDPVKFEDPATVHKTIAGNAILVWRLFGSYLQAFFGLFTLIGITFIQTKQIKAQNNVSKIMIK